MAEAIWRAGRKLGWEIHPIAPGELEGTLRLRSHVAIVRIPYDSRRFGIRYHESTNLMYENGRIHEQYNTWILNLERQIRAEPVVLAPRR